MEPSPKTAEEIRGLGALESHPWWKPTPIMLAFLIVVLVFIVNVIDLRLREADLYVATQQNHAIIVESRRVAAIAAQAAYHNCVVTRALVDWSNELGPIERVYHADRDAHLRRYRSFVKLRDTLVRVDGIPCAPIPR